MTVFLIVAPDPDSRLDAAVKAAFPDNNFVLTPSQYLVADDKATTPEIAEKIGAPGGGVGRVLITPVQNYSGWHNKDLWEWIVSRSTGATSPPASRNG